MAISFSNFDTLANTALDFYIREQPVGQNVQNKPLLEDLNETRKSFPGGQGYVSGPVQGQFASDQAGFFQWYSHTDQVTFVHPDNIQRAKYLWREAHGGVVLDFTELKQRGVSVDMSGNPVRSTNREIQIVKDWLAAVIEDDFGESLSRALNDALWNDGTQAAKAIVGITGLLDDDPTSGTVGSIDQGTYAWWRHRYNFNVPYSPENLSMLNFIDDEMIQLMRYDGNPDRAYAGSDWLGAMRREIRKSGQVMNPNWNSKQATQIKTADVVWGNMVFKYDPTLDQKGLSKRCYVMDSRHVKLMPMEDEDMKSHKATRPYDQFVLFKSVTSTMALCMDQLNCHGAYGIN